MRLRYAAAGKSVTIISKDFGRTNIMSYSAHHKDFAPYVGAPSARDKTNPPSITGFWQRLSNAVSKSRHCRAEREIARFIQGRGGHLTDELERDLMRHLTSSPRYWGMHL
jgi:hypothetical protein